MAVSTGWNGRRRGTSCAKSGLQETAGENVPAPAGVRLVLAESASVREPDVRVAAANALAWVRPAKAPGAAPAMRAWIRIRGRGALASTGDDTPDDRRVESSSTAGRQEDLGLVTQADESSRVAVTGVQLLERSDESVSQGAALRPV